MWLGWRSREYNGDGVKGDDYGGMVWNRLWVVFFTFSLLSEIWMKFMRKKWLYEILGVRSIVCMRACVLEFLVYFFVSFFENNVEWLKFDCF